MSDIYMKFKQDESEPEYENSYTAGGYEQPTRILMKPNKQTANQIFYVGWNKKYIIHCSLI